MQTVRKKSVMKKKSQNCAFIFQNSNFIFCICKLKYRNSEKKSERKKLELLDIRLQLYNL